MFRLPQAALLAMSMALPAGPALAEYHGNALVHARVLGGELFMMNAQHMTLYTYDRDTPGQSSCHDACAETWPPVTLPAGTALGENYGLITRRDGAMQAAYKGRPLYLFSGDRKIGDTKGDGVDGLWHISRP